MAHVELSALFKAVRIQIGLAWQHQPWWVDILSGTGAMAWALWVWIFPTDLGQRVSYHLAAGLASDAIWAAIGFLIGASQLFIALCDFRVARGIAALVACAFYVVIANSMIATDAGTPSIPLYYVFGGMGNALISMRLFRSKRGART